MTALAALVIIAGLYVGYTHLSTNQTAASTENTETQTTSVINNEQPTQKAVVKTQVSSDEGKVSNTVPSQSKAVIEETTTEDIDSTKN